MSLPRLGFDGATKTPTRTGHGDVARGSPTKMRPRERGEGKFHEDQATGNGYESKV